MDKINNFSSEQYFAQIFAKHVVQWAKQPITELQQQILYKVAYTVSLNVSQGQACAELSQIDEQSTEQKKRELLLQTSVVTDNLKNPQAPLVIDIKNRIYLQRYFMAEKHIVQSIIARTNVNEINPSVQTVLNRLMKKQDEAIDWQKIAVILALRKRFLVISGGPGTGKTTTVAKILACLLSQSPKNHIELAAPTGKAASRMQQSILNQLHDMPEEIKQAIPKQAQTIHRLIGLSQNAMKSQFNENNKLALDTLIVDEASMIDLSLAARLFHALPDHARVILLGDKDQLASVETGSLFAQLSQHKPVFTHECVEDVKKFCGEQLTENKTNFALADATVWLTKNHRFSKESAIGQIAEFIRNDKIDQALNFIKINDHRDFIWLQTSELPEDQFNQVCIQSYQQYIEYIKEIVSIQTPVNVAKAFDLLTHSSILCAIRNGRYSVNSVNELLQNHLCHVTQQNQLQWYIGRPIIITKNDYVANLRNGDIGIVLPELNNPQQPCVYFLDDKEEFKAVSIATISTCNSAYAITVHQSQGSEYNQITVIMPKNITPLLTRELLYTAITRAKKGVTLIANQSILETTLNNKIVRASGIADQLEQSN